MNDNSHTTHEGDSSVCIQVMVVVQLGEDVRSVRWKIGMEANEYLSPWRLINVSVMMTFHACIR